MQFNPQVSIMLGAFIIMQVFPDNVMARGWKSRHRGSLFGSIRKVTRLWYEVNTLFGSIANTVTSIFRWNRITTKQEDQSNKKITEQTAMKHIIMPASNPATDIMDEETLTLPNSRKGVKRIYSVEKKGTDSSSTKLEFATSTVENALNNLMLFLGDGLELLSEMINEKFDALDFIRGGDFNDTMIDEEQDSIRKQLRVQLDRTNRIFNDKEHGILTCVDETNNTFDLNLIAAERFAAMVENIEVLLADVSLKNTNSTEPNTNSTNPTAIDFTTTASAAVNTSAMNSTVAVSATTDTIVTASIRNEVDPLNPLSRSIREQLNYLMNE